MEMKVQCHKDLMAAINHGSDILEIKNELVATANKFCILLKGNNANVDTLVDVISRVEDQNNNILKINR